MSENSSAREAALKAYRKALEAGKPYPRPERTGTDAAPCAGLYASAEGASLAADASYTSGHEWEGHHHMVVAESYMIMGDACMAVHAGYDWLTS